MQLNQEQRRHQYTIINACKILEQADKPLSLKRLAARSAMSPWHFHRIFKSLLGVTPKQYASALQRQRAHRELRTQARITDAVYASGFETVGRFYARSRAMLGMAPAAFQAGGEGVELDFTVCQSKLGQLLVAATNEGICSVQFGGSEAELTLSLRELFPAAVIQRGSDQFNATVAVVAGLVGANGSGRDIPLDIKGTVFQEQVWKVLRGIPEGKTMSYTEVACAMGKPKAQRAVANACGANPVALLIPCHRVICADGKPGGYRWGAERKAQLLALEKK